MAELTKTGEELTGTDPTAEGRRPVVVVDDLHVKYRVHAGGKPVKGNGTYIAAASGRQSPDRACPQGDLLHCLRE